MKVYDLMTKNVVYASSDESISSALTKMKKYRVHQMPVIDEKLKGMLFLKKIITKDMDPAKSKVSSFASSTAVISVNETAEKAAEFLLQSGQRALPVVEKEKVVGIISETDLIKNVSIDMPVSQIMSECRCLEKKDDIGRGKKIMEYENVSRIPICESGKAIGIISMIDLIDIALGKQPYEARGVSGRGYNETVSTDKIPVETIMKKPIIIDRNKKINEIAGILEKNEEVLIEDGGIYIISPKDILELVASKPAKATCIQITHLGEEDDFSAGMVSDAANDFAEKIGRMLDVQSLVVHIDRIQKHGKKIHYFVRSRVYTSSGLFVSKSDGWELATAAQEALNKLEREVLKKHDKTSHHEAEKKSKMMRRR